MHDAGRIAVTMSNRQRAQLADDGSQEPRVSLTPGHWIDAAIQLLEDHGIDAVRVDDLARRLGVTRGSFYWHFKDRDDLLKGVLKSWRDAATEQIIERFDTRHSDPHALIKELISLPFRGARATRAASIELAIRAWARRDSKARQVVDEVDERRISYHAQVFSSLGFPVLEARARAFALYAYEVAESLLSNQGTQAQKAQRRALVEHMVLAPLPEKAGAVKPARSAKELDVPGA
jgi:AcrR family transcriptional regulator